jgi:glycosyltransferase involved in cell wall biosynthesis
MKESKKLLYVTNYEISDSSDGISKKINQQMDGFNNLGFEVDFLIKSSEGIKCKFGGKIKKIKIAKVFSYIYYFSIGVIVKEEKKRWDLVYIRNPHGGFFPLLFPVFLFIIRSKTKSLILEIPNYPYDNELNTLKGKVSLFSHKLVRPLLSRFVDEIYYMGALQNEIWGIKCRRIFNSMNKNQVNLVSRDGVAHKSRDKIIFVGVANVACYHGYDRLIRSIARFKGENCQSNYVFEVVSPINAECQKLINLVEMLGCTEEVKFHGRLSGVELDALFNNCHIGVDSLARHRVGNSYNDSIKSKEYAFRGLPIVKAHLDDAFQGADFVFDVNADDSTFDLPAIESWFHDLRTDPQNIRDYASERFVWEKQFENLLCGLCLEKYG